MQQQTQRPTLPENFRIWEMPGEKRGDIWYIPERRDTERAMWRSYDKGRNSYHWFKTWEGAYRFLTHKMPLPAGYELTEDNDTFYVWHQGNMTGHDFASESAARTFIWNRYNEGRAPMKSEDKS